MPNHCYNKLDIIGSEEVRNEILAKHFTEDSQLDFNTLIPYPQTCAEADKALQEESGYPHAFSTDGYNWCVENWGTKWNAYNCQVSKLFEDRTVVEFDTAWSPPFPIINKLSEMYPEVRFTLFYRDEGLAFEGEAVLERGEVVDFKEYEPVWEAEGV